MSRTFTIYAEEGIEHLFRKCKNLEKFPQVFINRQISPIEKGIYKCGFYVSDKVPKNYSLAQPEHILALLGHYPQILWQINHDTRVIQGNGITLHASIYPRCNKKTSSSEDTAWDNSPDDGLAHISAEPVLTMRGKFYKLYVKKIAEAPSLPEAEAPSLAEVANSSDLKISPFEGSLNHFLHREKISFPIVDLVSALKREVTIEPVEAKAGLLPINAIYSELGVCISRDDALEQMRVNRQRPGTLSELLLFLRDKPTLLTSDPIITLDDGYECRLHPSADMAPDTVVIDRYLPCCIGDHFQTKYFYLEER